MNIKKRIWKLSFFCYLLSVSFFGVFRSRSKRMRPILIGKLREAFVVGLLDSCPTDIKIFICAAICRGVVPPLKGVVAIYQPYSLTELNNLFNELCNCLNVADKIVITPVYKTDVLETATKTADDLYAKLKSQREVVMFANSQQEIQQILRKIEISQNDTILFIGAGAGSIVNWAHKIVRHIGEHV